MKRTPAVLAATAAGLAGVIVLHSGGRSTVLGAPPPTTIPAKGSAGTTSPPATSSGNGATGSALGPSEQYGYGVLAVKVSVRGGRITNVSVSNLQTAEPYSQSLAQQVIPMLRSEVLSAQSARINGISGATYTCEAYQISLQSALDRLGVK